MDVLAVRQIEWEGSRAEALAWLVPHLPEALLKEALGIVHMIRYGEDRARVLTRLAPHLFRIAVAGSAGNSK